DVVRGLEQQVARAGQGGDGAAPDAFDEAGGQVHVGAFNQPERDARGVELGLEGGDGGADAVAGVFVQPRIDVRGAGDGVDAVGDRHAGHLQRHFEVGGAIVDAGQEMVVEVDHPRNCTGATTGAGSAESG